jgi:hypothetical protein
MRPVGVHAIESKKFIGFAEPLYGLRLSRKKEKNYPIDRRRPESAPAGLKHVASYCWKAITSINRLLADTGSNA